MQHLLTTKKMLDQRYRYALFPRQRQLFFAKEHRGSPNLFLLYGANDLDVWPKRLDTKERLREREWPIPTMSLLLIL